MRAPPLTGAGEHLEDNGDDDDDDAQKQQRREQRARDGRPLATASVPANVGQHARMPHAGVVVFNAATTQVHFLLLRNSTCNGLHIPEVDIHYKKSSGQAEVHKTGQVHSKADYIAAQNGTLATGSQQRKEGVL